MEQINESEKKTTKFKYSVVNPVKEKISIAPMVDVSNNFFRYFMRQLTQNCFLYTEMINADAIINTPKDEGRCVILDYSKNQHPVVYQIGGNDPSRIAKAAKIVEQWGYDEVNLNCGCPSNKSKKGCFGARLMFDPELVA